MIVAKEVYEDGFRQANQDMISFKQTILTGVLDNARKSEQVKVMMRAINEQRAELADSNAKYRNTYQCPEHIEYEQFVAKSKDILEELRNIPVMQADSQLEDFTRGN